MASWTTWWCLVSSGLELSAGAHLLGNIKTATTGAKKGRNRGLLVAGEHVLGVSNSMVPHEEGHLQNSAAVSQDEDSGVTAVSYNTPYAVRQHEDTSLSHDAGRQAKFLEDALSQTRDKVLAIVKESIRQEMKL